MVIVKLTGGLGNQLFQYANSRAISMKKDTSLLLDTTWYNGRIDRSYMLGKFNIEAKIGSRIEIVLNKIFSPKDYIIGDFQSEKYFINIKDTIRREFSIKKPISDKNKKILEKIKSTDSISIHIRGGDYVRGKKSTFHSTCSNEYYNEAIDIIKSKVNLPIFFIFTDDIEWTKNNIKLPEPNIFISDNNNEPHEEMMLMSYCKHNIIANSTFSWWGAWLNNNKDKIVIGPKKWFNDISINTKDILPKSWIQI